jgi:hypothetical protein
MREDEKNDYGSKVLVNKQWLWLDRIMDRKELAGVQARPTRKSSIIAGKESTDHHPTAIKGCCLRNQDACT